MSDEVVFRRIRGRIVPIKKSQKSQRKEIKTINKPAVQAAIFSGLGFGIATGGGFLSGRAVKKAEDISQQSFDFLNEKKGIKLPKKVKSVGHGFQLARKKARFGFKSKTAFGIASAATLSLGITKGLEAVGADKPTLKQEAGREFAAVTTSTLLLTAFAKGAGVKRPKIKLPDSIKRTAGDLATSFVKKQLKFRL